MTHGPNNDESSTSKLRKLAVNFVAHLLGDRLS
jgi:hypothetical protein